MQYAQIAVVVLSPTTSISVKNINVPVGIIYCTACYAAIGAFDPVIYNKIYELKRIDKLGILESSREE